MELIRGGLAISLNMLDYDGETVNFPPEVFLILSEIENEANVRASKRNDLMKSLTLVRTVVSKSNPNFTTPLDFEGKSYIIFRDIDRDRINIQEGIHRGTDKGLLSISLSPNDTDNFEVEGENVSSIPDSIMALYDAVVAEAYKRSSIYAQTRVLVVRDGIKRIPEWHLNQLATSNMIDLNVSFLSENVTVEIGTDVGGLKRDYIATLCAALQESDKLFISAEGSLKLPRILREGEEPILYCTKEEALTYENLGNALFAGCFESKGRTSRFGTFEQDLIMTGRYFSDALFKAVLSLKESDFPDQGHPQDKVYVKIAKALLKHLDTEGTPYIKNYINFLDLTCDSLDQILKPDNQILAEAAMLAGYDEYTHDNGDPDVEKIKSDPQKFINDLQAGVFKDKELVKAFNGVSLGAILDPVYQVAQGMRKGISTSWSDFRGNDPVRVSDKIQGVIDRETIIENILCTSRDSIVKEKARWLKEWIEEDATDDELKVFLKFVTGGASLPKGKKLRVDEYGYNPFPSVCTCGLGLRVSAHKSYSNWNKDLWDNTKEQFIKNLKQAMVIEGFQNS